MIGRGLAGRAVAAGRHSGPNNAALQGVSRSIVASRSLTTRRSVVPSLTHVVTLQPRTNRGVGGVQEKRFNSSASKLSSYLQVEIDGETSAGKSSVDEFLGESPFALDTKETKESYIVLRNGNATVEFEATDFEHGEEGETGIEFEVIITNDTQKKDMIFECIAQKESEDEPATLLLERIVMQKTGKEDQDEAAYSPSFAELDDNVQESFFDFLRDHGVDNGFAEAVLEIAEAKEGSAYMAWLNDAKSFVDTTNNSELEKQSVIDELNDVSTASAFFLLHPTFNNHAADY
eukprot:CAMPEP_0184540610 /NCGR_PEP_ID=MMETSP0199_2-20130426/802_1 /TAXON_ID=1112570 /ORGANISM="Thraustochytrium sp., Strain LLF1b" /LENGTH=289 /DNA_ID=CAMNT_0026934237 /DNA_START=64 /DNA_END=934 /DNA_ORIENTATION=+